MTVTAVRKDARSRTVTLEAEFDAPPERVWQLWADPRQLERWWGPPTSPATVEAHDLRPGGHVAYRMTGPEGEDHRGFWDVDEVQPPQRLVFRDGFANRDGTPNAGLPLTTLRVTIRDLGGGRTRMSIESEFPTAEAMERLAAMGTEEGRRQAVGQIDALLAEGPAGAGGDRRALRRQPNDDRTTERGTATMKLTTTAQVSVDGVMQGPGGPEEDERGVFERGGWAMPHFDDDAMTAMEEIFQRADAFLFGRRTYEIFARSWGTGSWGENQGHNPISVALNTRPKYVASTTLTDPRWADTTVLSGEVAAAVRELKARPGRELQVHGCGALFRWLLDHDLVDELTLFVCPVVVGQGTRLFPDTGQDRALDLVDSRSTPSGVTIQVYRPAGRPQYATATPRPT